MKKFYILVLSILAIPLAFLGYILLAYSRNRRRATHFYNSDGRPRDDGTRLALTPVKTLEVLPLVEWYTAQEALETESGVSYLDVLTAYGAPELTAMYCQLDDLAYAAKSPSIRWERTKTLGRGGDCCDFRWSQVEPGQGTIRLIQVQSSAKKEKNSSLSK